jgi:hypothetical protein
MISIAPYCPALEGGDKINYTMKKDQWINEILSSAKDITPVSSNAFLATRIEGRVQLLPLFTKIPLKWVLVSAAAMVLLLTINMAIWRNVSQHSTPGAQQLIQEYGWASNDLYPANLSNPSNE